MPSYGSLQQAVKVRPRRGEPEVGLAQCCIISASTSRRASAAPKSGQHTNPVRLFVCLVRLGQLHMEACRNVGRLFACSLSCIPLLLIPVQSKHRQDSCLRRCINQHWPTAGQWTCTGPHIAHYQTTTTTTLPSSPLFLIVSSKGLLAQSF